MTATTTSKGTSDVRTASGDAASEPQLQAQLRMRNYCDESGTAGPMNPADPLSRYLALVGCAIPQDGRYEKFTALFNELKAKYLPLPKWADRDIAPCILHREDIVARRAPYFECLRNDATRAKFDRALLDAIEQSTFLLYAVVLDKQKHHAAGYRVIKDDYHYCMEALLERYCGRMRMKKCVGDVMAESRGGSQDKALKEVFKNLATNGGRYFKERDRARLTSKEIKLKPKTANILGLQLADIVARDVKREMLAKRGLCEAPTGFSAELLKLLEKKYNRQLFTGRIDGYGQVWL